MEEHARKKRAVKIEGVIQVVDVPVSPHGEAPHTSRQSTPLFEERFVALRELVEARRSEVLLFESKFRKTSGGTHGGDGHQKRAFQLLPRHMRRRAMSYNPYLVPFRLRERAKRESESTEAPTGQHLRVGGGWRPSHKRSPHRLLNLIKPGPKPNFQDQESQLSKSLQNRPFHVLETHLWHAKRFHMFEYAGYKIPGQATLRGRRAVLQMGETGALALDSSFVRSLVITAPSHVCASFILNHLSLDAHTLLLPFNLRRLHLCFLQKRLSLDDSSNGNTINVSHIYAPIAPCHLHAIQLQDKRRIRLFFWLDPHAFKETQHEIQHIISKYQQHPKSQDDTEVEVCATWDALGNRFELLGPKCNLVLQKLLLPYDEKDNEQLNKYLANRPKCIPPGTTLVVRVKDPRITRYAQRLSPSLPSKSTQPSVPNSLSSMLSKLVLHETRSGRKSDFDVGVASNTSIDGCSLLSSGEYDWCVYKDHETEDVKRMEEVLKKSSTFVVLQRFPDGDDGTEGWILTTPISWGSTFWKRAIRSGARPIGRRERCDMRLEHLSPRYPEDFPGTSGYAVYSRIMAEELRKKWTGRPSQKRMNFAKLGVSSPFQPDWCTLYMSSNGVYMEMSSHDIINSYQFGARSQLYEKLDAKDRRNIAKSEWHQIEKSSFVKSHASSSSSSKDESSDSMIKRVVLVLVPVSLVMEEGGTVPNYNAHVYEPGSTADSMPIGFVTSGAYLRSRGKGCAIAFVAGEALIRLKSRGGPLTLMLRNTTSKCFHKANVLDLDTIFG